VIDLITAIEWRNLAMTRIVKKFALVIFLLTATSSIASDLYKLKMKDSRGGDIDFTKFKNKLMLIVNVASGCGFTPQLGEMTTVHEKYRDKGLEVLAIPSNSFNQEKLDSVKVGDFCELKYKAKYTVTEKSDVIGDNKISLYKFLVNNSPADKGKDVAWNFHKFIVDKKGAVIARFPSNISPTSKEITDIIEKNL
jgi:glutathione peroxidase